MHECMTSGYTQLTRSTRGLSATAELLVFYVMYFMHFWRATGKIILFSSFLSRVSILTRDIDIANLSVCPSVCLSVCYVPVSDKNGLPYAQFFSPYGSPIILVLPPSNTFTKFRRGHPQRGAIYRWV